MEETGLVKRDETTAVAATSKKANIMKIGSLAVRLSSLTKEDVEVIKTTVAKGATNDELAFFLRICDTYQLDPFLKEIWFVKYASKNPKTGKYDYENSEGTVMASRDGLMKCARGSGNFKLFRSSCVYTGEHFKLDKVTDTIEHVIEAKKAGELLGAWAWGKRSDGQEYLFYCDFAKYCKDSPIWKKNPDAMILARAESIVLKKLWGISGVYSDAEIDEGDVIDIRPLYPEERFEHDRARLLAANNIDEAESVMSELSGYIIPDAIREDFKRAVQHRRQQEKNGDPEPSRADFEGVFKMMGNAEDLETLNQVYNDAAAKPNVPKEIRVEMLEVKHARERYLKAAVVQEKPKTDDPGPIEYDVKPTKLVVAHDGPVLVEFETPEIKDKGNYGVGKSMFEEIRKKNSSKTIRDDKASGIIKYMDKQYVVVAGQYGGGQPEKYTAYRVRVLEDDESGKSFDDMIGGDYVGMEFYWWNKRWLILPERIHFVLEGTAIDGTITDTPGCPMDTDQDMEKIRSLLAQLEDAKQSNWEEQITRSFNVDDIADLKPADKPKVITLLNQLVSRLIK